MLEHLATLVELFKFSCDCDPLSPALLSLFLVSFCLFLLFSVDLGDLGVEEIVDDDGVLEDLERLSILHDHLGKLNFVLS